MNPVGIGVVGAGAFGQFCLETFAAMDTVHIAAVADSIFERAKALASRCEASAYPTLEAVLADPAVEVVVLSTPPHLHAPQGMAALHAGKHLFCEKPLAISVEDGEKLLGAAEASGLLLTVNYVMRHNPFWKVAAALAHSGVLGALRHMSLINHAAGLSLPPDHWFWDERLSGGIWIEHGVHFFDAFAWVSGAQGEALAAVGYRRPDGATDRVEALLRYGDVAAHCYHGFDHSGQDEQTTVYLAFEQGYVTLREWIPTSLELITLVNKAVWSAYLPGVADYFDLPNGQVRAFSHAPEGKSALYRQSIRAGMEELALAVRSMQQGMQRDMTVAGAEALASLKTAVQAQRLTEQADRTG